MTLLLFFQNKQEHGTTKRVIKYRWIHTKSEKGRKRANSAVAMAVAGQYTWTETANAISLSVPLKGCSPSRVDIYGTYSYCASRRNARGHGGAVIEQLTMNVRVHYEYSH